MASRKCNSRTRDEYTPWEHFDCLQHTRYTEVVSIQGCKADQQLAAASCEARNAVAMNQDRGWKDTILVDIRARVFVLNATTRNFT